MMNILIRLLSKFMRKKKTYKDVFENVNPVIIYLINKPYAKYVDFEEVK